MDAESRWLLRAITLSCLVAPSRKLIASSGHNVGLSTSSKNEEDNNAKVETKKRMHLELKVANLFPYELK